MTELPAGLTYRDSGVNIDAGNQLVERIQPLAARTHRPGVLAGLGGFGALFEIPIHQYKNPVLVSGTDGVGTKLLLAQQWRRPAGIGIDLVAMCVNDILVQGAEPLFFLDYFATGHLEPANAARILESIAEGCIIAGCALVGGETAEMPGLYRPDEYDLAGFAVGIVEKEALLDGSAIQAGDVVLGLASSGPHANGYSLIRRILETANLSPEDSFSGETDQSLADALLAPTRIYVQPLLQLLKTRSIHAMAHITGGGLTENLPRVLPPHVSVRIQTRSWTLPPIFRWLQQQGNISDAEMRRTFNCGVGMVLILPPEEANPVCTELQAQGIEAWVLGEIHADQETSAVQYVS